MRYPGCTRRGRNCVRRSLSVNAQRNEQANSGDGRVAAPSPESITCFVVLNNCVQRDLSVKANYSSSTYRPCSVSAESAESSMAGS
jgi:hypothetical protein